MYEIENLKELRDDDIKAILRAWESAVRSTHGFLDEDSIVEFIPQVREAVKYVNTLLVVRDESGDIIGFEGIHEEKIEMLFIHDDYRGYGIGKTLIVEAIENYGAIAVDVNEQNPSGLGFYRHMGFEIKSRSETDDDGNPYPILHLGL